MALHHKNSHPRDKLRRPRSLHRGNLGKAGQQVSYLRSRLLSTSRSRTDRTGLRRDHHREDARRAWLHLHSMVAQLPCDGLRVDLEPTVEIPASDERQADKGDVIKGVAASPGKVTGVARILHGLDDFSG